MRKEPETRTWTLDVRFRIGFGVICVGWLTGSKIWSLKVAVKPSEPYSQLLVSCHGIQRHILTYKIIMDGGCILILPNLTQLLLYNLTSVHLAAAVFTNTEKRATSSRDAWNPSADSSQSAAGHTSFITF